ncbi:hypothetical protein ACFC26_39210 [Kitasatospora purpeofusca]|uniref:vWA domain-containing protein n=1 Tax=Kitasatospora purpeofusca TaxID=67352 RepID=UPI0035E113C9
MTPPTLPLILSEERVPRGQLAPVKASRPSAAAVYATVGGELACFDGRPLSWTRQVFSRYRIRYEVDLGDHRRMARLENWPLPSSDQVHRFEATVDVGFRVHDPVEVVRRNIKDALIVVYGHIAATLRPYARGFAIDDAKRAEAYMNHECAAGMVLAEGITIYRCVVELHPDAAARGYVESLRDADRQLQLGKAAHTAAVAEQRSKEMLEALEQEARLRREKAEQEARLALEEARRRALAATTFDFEGLVKQHLLTHPDDTAEAIEMRARWELALAGRQEQFDERSVEVFKFMVENDLIQPADVEVIRQQALQRVQGASLPGGGSALPPVYWGGRAAAPPGLPTAPPVAPPQQQPSQAQPSGGGSGPGAPLQGKVVTGAGAAAATGGGGGPVAAGGPGGGILPVYLLIDESAAVAGCVTALNNALRALHAALLTADGAARSLRLSVLGSAGETSVHLAVTEVEWTTRMPELAVRAGARHDRAFDRLREVVPADVARLKSEHAVVLRPVVFALFGGPCDPGAPRAEALRRLTDPAANPLYPTIVAVGIGRADEAEIAATAARPELGFVADPGLDPTSAAERFASLLQDTVLHLGRGLAAGRLDLLVECPPGLRRVAAAG